MIEVILLTALVSSPYVILLWLFGRFAVQLFEDQDRRHEEQRKAWDWLPSRQSAKLKTPNNCEIEGR